MMKLQPGDVTLTIRPLPNGYGEPDATQRLRSLLKAMLRSYRYRCLDCRSALPSVPAELDPCMSEPPFVPPTHDLAEK